MIHIVSVILLWQTGLENIFIVTSNNFNTLCMIILLSRIFLSVIQHNWVRVFNNLKIFTKLFSSCLVIAICVPLLFITLDIIEKSLHLGCCYLDQEISIHFFHPFFWNLSVQIQIPVEKSMGNHTFRSRKQTKNWKVLCN